MNNGSVKELLYIYIGKAIVAQRHKAGMTQQQLGAATGISRTSMTNIECGRQRTPIDSLYKIALALGCDVTDLLPPTSQKVLEDGRAVLDKAIVEAIRASIVSGDGE